MKYVAFLDILGFKEKLRNLSQDEAKKYIGDFSEIVYSIFKDSERDSVKGYIVSDSIILHTVDTTKKSLGLLIYLIEKICREEFSKQGILIRGAIAKGEFNDIPAKELKNLGKRLIVGQAYVEAYSLEGSVKNIGINLAAAVYQDFLKYDLSLNIFEEKIGSKTHYIFRYITLDYLLEKENLNKFVDLAKEAKWLPHYYNAIYFATLKSEKNHQKVDQIFVDIQNILLDNDRRKNWREIDLFIKNTFSEGVIEAYKTRFLRFIRSKMSL